MRSRRAIYDGVQGAPLLGANAQSSNRPCHGLALYSNKLIISSQLRDTTLVSRLLNSYTIADGACEARSRSDEEADDISSPTNRDDEIDRNLHRPFGLRRNGPVFVVAPRSQ